MLQDEQGGVCHYDAAAGDFDYTGGANAGEADFLFVEHHPATFAGGQPGDVAAAARWLTPFGRVRHQVPAEWRCVKGAVHRAAPFCLRSARATANSGD